RLGSAVEDVEDLDVRMLVHRRDVARLRRLDAGAHGRAALVVADDQLVVRERAEAHLLGIFEANDRRLFHRVFSVMAHLPVAIKAGGYHPTQHHAQRRRERDADARRDRHADGRAPPALLAARRRRRSTRRTAHAGRAPHGRGSRALQGHARRLWPARPPLSTQARRSLLWRTRGPRTALPLPWL